MHPVRVNYRKLFGHIFCCNKSGLAANFAALREKRNFMFE